MSKDNHLGFRNEVFRRRCRYVLVFAILIVAFFTITVLNINTGSVNMPVPNIFKALFLREGTEKIGRAHV